MFQILLLLKYLWRFNLELYYSLKFQCNNHKDDSSVVPGSSKSLTPRERRLPLFPKSLLATEIHAFWSSKHQSVKSLKQFEQKLTLLRKID